MWIGSKKPQLLVRIMAENNNANEELMNEIVH